MTIKQQWKINYYVASLGKLSPLIPFIENLPEKTQSKLSNTFSLLQEFGNHVGPPHVKKLTGTPLWELRILGQDNIRIFYIISGKETFLLLHGFVKKKQKTSIKEIKIALARLKEYKSRVSKKSLPH